MLARAACVTHHNVPAMWLQITCYMHSSGHRARGLEVTSAGRGRQPRSTTFSTCVLPVLSSTLDVQIRMARFTLCLVAVALFAVSAFAEEEHVVTLTPENFSDVVKNNDKLVVEFYAPWCGHCKNLTPEYEQAAKELKASGIVLAKMDATEAGNKEISAKFDVKGFPTLKIFRGDETNASEYQVRCWTCVAAACTTHRQSQAPAFAVTCWNLRHLWWLRAAVRSAHTCHRV